MHGAAVLATVAALIVHHPTSVNCHAPDGGWQDAVGWTIWEPDATVYLKFCQDTLERRRWAVDVFAHELLHVKHPYWTERRVERLEHMFGGIVGRVLLEVEAYAAMREENRCIRQSA